MGEIGFPRQEFLHSLRWWEAQSIIRGYNARSRAMWSANRWQTYNLMCAFGCDLKKAGINSPSDLIQFPWDKAESPTPHATQEDINDLQALMDTENKRLQEE